MAEFDDHRIQTPKISNCKNILKYTRYAMIVAGVFEHEKGTTSSILYKTWCYLSKIYFLLFFSTCLVGLVRDVLMDEEDEETLNVNIQAFLLTFTVLLKFLLSNTKGIRDKIREVNQFEYDITNDDVECTRIYNKKSRYNYKIFFATLFMTNPTAALFSFNNFNEWKRINVGNATGGKLLIYSGWFPFDLENRSFFNAAYFFQSLIGIWAPMFVLTFDCLFISIMNFATARADILGYKLENLEMYSKGRSEATYQCLRNIIMEHKNLIKFVEEIDSSLKWYFLVEVLVKSYHITLSLINVINATREDIYFYFTFLIVLLSQVFMYYYNANELSIASTHLSVRIFKSNWYDQSPEVVRSLSIMMMRVQRPLVLTIAGIRVIDIELFVSIIKAGYTFILYQEIGRDS